MNEPTDTPTPRADAIDAEIVAIIANNKTLNDAIEASIKLLFRHARLLERENQQLQRELGEVKQQAKVSDAERRAYIADLESHQQDLLNQRDVALGLLGGDNIPDSTIKIVLGECVISERWHKERLKEDLNHFKQLAEERWKMCEELAFNLAGSHRETPCNNPECHVHKLLPHFHSLQQQKKDEQP